MSRKSTYKRVGLYVEPVLFDSILNKVKKYDISMTAFCIDAIIDHLDNIDDYMINKRKSIIKQKITNLEKELFSEDDLYPNKNTNRDIEDRKLKESINVR